MPIISPESLAALISAGGPLRLLDVRWRLDKPVGRDDYLAGHLPGAVYVDLDSELSRRGSPDEGRHPLPARAALEAAARRWGINDGEQAVVYDDALGMPAARAWWLLARSGHANVRVLDGGLRGWVDAGGGLETDDVTPVPGSVRLHEITDGVIDQDTAAALPGHGVLLDVRAAERYRGDTEPIDPVAGHIPGARNLPTTVHLENGRLRSPEALRERFAAVGVTGERPAAAYCGSGVTAAHTALAAAVAGLSLDVYPGSWSAWSNTPGRPVATCSQPG